MTILTTALEVLAGLQPEDEIPPEMNIEAAPSADLDRIVRPYIMLHYKINTATSLSSELLHELLEELTPVQEPAALITKAALVLPYKVPDGDVLLGYYLSRLMNNSADRIHTLYTAHYPQPIHCIGNAFPGDKTLFVHGPAGSDLGIHNCGTIVVNGSAGDSLGLGNTGTITINGDSGSWIGLNNLGVIHLNGAYKSLDFIACGRGTIYHKGTPIVLNGVILCRKP